MKLSERTACTECETVGRCACNAPRILAELREFRGVLDGGFDPLVDELGDWHCDAAALDAGVSTAPFGAGNVVAIAALATGASDGPPWLAIVGLSDGRWVYVRHEFQATGDVLWTYRFAATRDRLWFWACTDDDRERLTLSLSRIERDEELVALDAMLDSGGPAEVALAERRMAQRVKRAT